MRAPSTISLFSEQHELNRRPYSILFSSLAHVLVVGLVFLGLTAPKIKPSKIAERYVVRHLDLESLDSEMQQAREQVKQPPSHTSVHAPTIAPKSVDAPPPVLRVALQAPRGKQTLIQPDIPKPVAMNVEIPVPTVVIWSGKPVKVKTISPPPPARPMVTNFKPSVLTPNNEPNLAEIPIPVNALAVHTQPIFAGTTAPVVISGPKPTPPVPLTTAKGTAQPTPTPLVALSDNQMAKGPISLPPVNSSAMNPTQGMLAAAKQQDQTGHGRPNDQPTARTADNSPSKSAAKPSTGQSTGSGNAQAQQGMGLESYPHAAHIVRQRDGHYGSVIIGSALQDKYPEMTDLLGGKMSYSVYVNVGLPKSWPLEYALARSENESGKAAGQRAVCP